MTEAVFYGLGIIAMYVGYGDVEEVIHTTAFFISFMATSIVLKYLRS